MNRLAGFAMGERKKSLAWRDFFWNLFHAPALFRHPKRSSPLDRSMQTEKGSSPSLPFFASGGGYRDTGREKIWAAFRTRANSVAS
ncbi:hypothetical protein VSX60_05775 [Aurantimonas sp. A3-2-R12]|nr:hypothetical protein [Aurantimonas sp. A3-2-R12]